MIKIDQPLHKYEFIANKTEKPTVLFISDIHLDSIYCQRNLLKRHLREAQETGAKVFILGDIFDAMQGRHDKRRRKEEDITKTSAYFNSIINDAFEFFKPFAADIAFISYGNHELSVLELAGNDLIEFLVNRLNDNGGNITIGNYAGFLRFAFTHAEGQAIKRTFDIYYTHGAGGSAPVTDGIIKAKHMATAINADMIISGHTHSTFHHEIERLSVTSRGQIHQTKTHLVKTSTYKLEETLGNGFAAQRGFNPAPLGGYWVSFRLEPAINDPYATGIKATLTRAD